MVTCYLTRRWPANKVETCCIIKYFKLCCVSWYYVTANNINALTLMILKVVPVCLKHCGEQVLIMIWCIAEHFQLDGAPWRRRQQTPNASQQVANMWYSMHSMVRKCCLMKVIRGAPFTLAGVSFFTIAVRKPYRFYKSVRPVVARSR